MNNNFIYFFYIVVIVIVIVIVIILFLFLFYNFKFTECYKNNSKKEANDTKYWGLDYRNSLQNDNYWVPQLNLHPTYIFYDPDYDES